MVVSPGLKREASLTLHGHTAVSSVLYYQLTTLDNVAAAALPHEFKGDAEMVPEVEVVYHVNGVVLIVSVLW